MNDEMLTQEATAQMLGVSRTTMHRMLKSGQLKGLKAGGQWRFRHADVMAYLERGPQPLSPLALEGVEEELQFFRSLVDGESVSLLRGDEGESEESAKLVTLVNAILLPALGNGATGTHFEPSREGMQLRQRIDGALHPVRTLPSKLGAAVVTCLKRLVGMDAAPSQLPQEGRVVVRHREREFNLSLATMPTQRGEALTIGITMRQSGFSELAKMDLREEQKAELLEWMGRPYGLILACGPTGSGKDTLVYGLLREVTTGDRKVVSVEDPVEFDLPGVMQISCNARAGLNLVTAARGIVSLDPDVVMLARLSDAETAEAALAIAGEGRLVLTSMNVPHIQHALGRFLDAGIDLMVLESLLLGVVSMQLLRCVCPECAQTVEIPPSTEETLRLVAAEGGYEVPERVKWKQGVGCSKCRQSGYLGRRPIYELVKWNETLPHITRHGSDAPSLEDAAQQGGSILKAEGVRLAVEGVTSPYEVMRTLLVPLGWRTGKTP